MRRFILFIVAMLCMAAAYAQSFDSAPKSKTAILMILTLSLCKIHAE